VVAVPVETEPKALEAGVVMERAPPVRVNVVVVSPVVAARAGPATPPTTSPAAKAMVVSFERILMSCGSPVG
jgi:hypothetical protein